MLALDTDANMADKKNHLILCAITIDIIIVMLFCFFPMAAQSQPYTYSSSAEDLLSIPALLVGLNETI